MSALNINLTEKLDKFVLSQIESGKFENASEVVRTALRKMEHEEQEYQARLANLRALIEEGDASGESDLNVLQIMERVEAKLRANGEL